MERKKRHGLIYRFLYIFIRPILCCIWRYRYRVMEGAAAPMLIVSNHTTDLDPALVAMSFPQPLVFVASEHVYRFGFASRLLRFCFDPIVRVKGKTDARVVKQILRALRGGHNVCLFAEGNRSFSGLTRAIFPATGKLARAAGATLVTYRIQGGYFAAPRWGAKMRKGPIWGGPVKVYTPQQLREMGDDEVNAAIQQDIDEDAYATQAKNPVAYRSKIPAQDIETALYLCPSCRRLGSLRSHGDSFECSCGLRGRYDLYGTLSGSGFEFTSVRDWAGWQLRELPGVLEGLGDGPICRDEAQQLYAVQPGVGSTPIAQGALELYRDRLCCAGREFPLSSISDLAIVSQRTLLFATQEGPMYEIKSPAPRSALKYQQVYELLCRPVAGRA